MKSQLQSAMPNWHPPSHDHMMSPSMQAQMRDPGCTSMTRWAWATTARWELRLRDRSSGGLVQGVQDMTTSPSRAGPVPCEFLTRVACFSTNEDPPPPPPPPPSPLVRCPPAPPPPPP
jgi:hypothetical protein